MGVLADYRTTVAGALELLDPEWSVHRAPVDALEPPAFMLRWGDGGPDSTWLVRSTHCVHGARLDVVCVAARIDPEPGIETIELMVERAVVALDAVRVPVVDVRGPGPFEIGGLTYQAARLVVASPVTIGGP